MLTLLAAMLPAQALDDATLCQLLARFNAAAHAPLPTLTTRQRLHLLEGEVVKVVEEQSDGVLRVVGLLLSTQSREAMWLSTQDPHFTSEDDAIEVAVEVTPHRAKWYAIIDLPGPFKSRHWVVEVWNNLDLAQQSGGEFWERLWDLDAASMAVVREKVERGTVPGLTVEAFDDALLTPINRGSWLFARVPGGSLTSYSITSTVGGNIPDRMVTEYVRATMESELLTVEARAREVVPQHYRGEHAPVLGMDGLPVPLYP